MSIENSLLGKYTGFTIAKGGERLFRYPLALELIGDCERRGLTILGMDFYVELDDHIVELIGSSADFSELSGRADAVPRSTAAARALLSDGLPDAATFVSFVLSED